MEKDPTKRFSARVENYTKFRPGYPTAVLDYLRQDYQLNPASVIADIGSGTGISSELFLASGNKVFGVEPNDEMRKAAEENLASFQNFMSVNGKAEATTLAPRSVDFIVAGQSFHWFDRQECRKEFSRILKPGGYVVLLWNDRRQETSFSHAYEELLKTYAIDYEKIDHRLITKDVLKEFFGNADFDLRTFDHVQVHNRDGLKGRVLSCSYMPMPDHPRYEKMTVELDRLFERYHQNGVVRMQYQTLVYSGRL